MATAVGVVLGVVSILLGIWSIKLGRVALRAGATTDRTIRKLASMVFVAELRTIAEARDRMRLAVEANNEDAVWDAMRSVRRSLDVVVDYADEAGDELRSDLGASVLSALRDFSRTLAAQTIKSLTSLIPGIVQVASEIDPDRAQEFQQFQTVKR